MKHSRLLALAIGSALACGTTYASDGDSQRIKALEQKVAALENNQRKTDWTDNIRISGFGSIVAFQESEDAGYVDLQDTSGDLNFESESKFGLQLNGDITDSTSFTAQILSKGIADWDLNLEWAYLSHTFDNDVTVRGGKLRLPVYMFADYLDVGYAQPFLRAPKDVYFPLSVSSYMGVDLMYTMDAGDGQITFQPYYGASAETEAESSTTGTIVDFNDLIGLVVKYELDELMLRASYSEAKGESDDPILAPLFDGVSGSFVELGFRYDFEQFSVLGEYTEYEVESLYPTIESWFVGLIYNLDEFTPYLTYSSAESTDNDQRDIIPGQPYSSFNGERNSYSLGVRWDFAPRIAFKADVTYSDNFGDTSGFMQGNIGQAPSGLPAAVDNFSDVTVLSAGFDFIF